MSIARPNVIVKLKKLQSCSAKERSADPPAMQHKNPAMQCLVHDNRYHINRLQSQELDNSNSNICISNPWRQLSSERMGSSRTRQHLTNL